MYVRKSWTGFERGKSESSHRPIRPITRLGSTKLDLWSVLFCLV